MSAHRPFLLGISGGSGSGKTYFARAVQRALGPEHCEIIYQDNFYFDQSGRFDFDGGAVNFDHPDSIDFKALGKALIQLRTGQLTQLPIYDFVTHRRKQETLNVLARPVILIDGILIFHLPEIRALFDDLVFFDTPEELRFARRLKRDVEERGRSPDGVRAQFLNQVKPMHDQFVEPSKVYASTVVNEVSEFPSVLHNYTMKLRAQFP